MQSPKVNLALRCSSLHALCISFRLAKYRDGVSFFFASETIASFSFLASSAILAESASCSICFTTSSHTCTDIEEPPLNSALSSIHSPDGSLYAKMRQGSGSPFLAKANPDVCHLPRSLRGGFFSNRQNHALTAASPSLLRTPANPAANVVDVPVATLQEDSTPS